MKMSGGETDESAKAAPRSNGGGSSAADLASTYSWIAGTHLSGRRQRSRQRRCIC